MSIFEKYEAVIGVEVHVELNTASKIFCACSTRYGAPPNTQVCPVCLGLPGALPRLNEAVVELAIRAGLATNCKIRTLSRMARKNYFYPDLPKGFQITQSSLPLCYDGYLDVRVGDATRRVGIERIHIEEDAGKLIHTSDATLIDYNRCGVPLIEIVSRPDMRSSQEAREFLSLLRSVMLFANISDCKMNEGSLRCDVNVSLRERGCERLGTKVELKNLNSFAFAARAIDYEIARQGERLEAGESILPETRRFDEATGKTLPMRSKESAEDYRYLDEPNIPPFCISEQTIERIASELPERAADKQQRYSREYKISESDAKILTESPALAAFFEAAARHTRHPRLAANLLISDLLSLTSAEGFAAPFEPSCLGEVADLLGDKEINSSVAKTLLRLVRDGEHKSASPKALVALLDMRQIRDEARLRAEIEAARAQFPKLFADYEGGKSAAKKAIIGKIMAATGGRADPVALDTLIG